MRKLLVSLIASGLALAQAPRVGLVELCGVRKVSAERLRNAIAVQAGDPLPTKADIEERLEKVPGVVLARVQAVCCAGDGAVLYVGIEERDAPHVGFRQPPGGNISLPPVLIDIYRDFIAYFGEAARSGDPTGPAADGYRGTFEHLARDNADILHRVLRESDDAGERAIAVYILRYAPITRAVADDLQYAMLDDDQAVRANAMRSLVALAASAARDPDLGVGIEITWFVELLNSLAWDDRTQAATALVNLTQAREPGALEHLRDRALPALADMAHWKTPAHAHAAFVLVGRIAGLADKEIEDAWSRGDREAVIKRALDQMKQKAGATWPRPHWQTSELNVVTVRPEAPADAVRAPETAIGAALLLRSGESVPG